MTLEIQQACQKYCFDCMFWRYKREKYRKGECKFAKISNHIGTHRACEHFKKI